MSLFETLGQAFAPHPVIDQWEWERDGDQIQVSLTLRDEVKEITLTQKDFGAWLKSNEYLSGSTDYYGPENDYQGEPRTYNHTYSEYIESHLTWDVIEEYLTETYQYKFA